METYRLASHPEHSSAKVRSVDAYIVRNRQNYLHLRWRIKGTSRVVIPDWTGEGRKDGLWQATCFELFLRHPEDQAYCEFNFSPSGRWAAYAFESYREGMADYAMPHPPVCQVRRHAQILTMDIQIRSSVLPPRPWQIGLSAVVVETDVAKSYWALAHPPGKPDFHHPACFAATLAPPENP